MSAEPHPVVGGAFLVGMIGLVGYWVVSYSGPYAWISDLQADLLSGNYYPMVSMLLSALMVLAVVGIPVVLVGVAISPGGRTKRRRPEPKASASQRPPSRSALSQMNGRLVPIGFFQELGGKDGATSVRDAARRQGDPDDELMADYLDDGEVLIYSPGVIFDEVTADDTPIGSMTILTDGRFMWPEVLGYYVRHHHVALPLRIVEHARQQDFRVPEEIDVESLDYSAL